MAGEQSGFDERAKSWDDDPMKTARAQAVADGMGKAASWKPGMRAIEFGCGTGLLSFALQARFAAITLADTSPGMLDVLRQKIEMAGLPHMQAVLLDDSATMNGQPFDMVYSLMTLHHVPDVNVALRRFHDWLGDGGQLCIADLDAEDGSFHDHDPSVHNGFERAQLAGMVAAAGFDNIRFSTVFQIVKGNSARTYPVFLMIATKD